MAIACFLLVTFLPEPPLRSVPAFISFMVFSTFLPLAALYLRATLTSNKAKCGVFKPAARRTPFA